MKVFSPAKINLFLKVLRKRSDGYHELSSLFQTINLCDTLDFELYGKGTDILTCSDSSLPTDNSNLVLKATQLFRRKTGINLGLKIHLDKKIPSQAGLGGGSGNAATTLWAFNQLVGNIATEEELQAWSAEIGSDIPFFFSQGTAHCTGRGECVHNLSDLPEEPCVIVKPLIGTSTPHIYKQLGMSPQSDSTFHPSFTFHSDFLHSNQYFNDLEKPAFEVIPELENLKKRLLQCGFKTVLMTGSGSAFFCLGQGKVPKLPYISIFSARFLNRKPLKWYENSNFIN